MTPAPVPPSASFDMLGFTTMESPVGRLSLVGGDAGLAAILWENDSPRRVPLPPLAAAPEHPLLVETARQLAAYFDGRLRRFDLPLAPRGTAFQRAVWAALCEIPYGETRGYGVLARELGRPAAARAVGAANGRNPLSIVVPCHRLVGAAGGLTGFAGGLAAKHRLLVLEGAVPAAQPAASTR